MATKNHYVCNYNNKYYNTQRRTGASTIQGQSVYIEDQGQLLGSCMNLLAK